MPASAPPRAARALVAALVLVSLAHAQPLPAPAAAPARGPASARALRPPHAAAAAGAAAARSPSAAPHTLGWTNMGVLLNASSPELGVQALAVVGGRPYVGLAGLAARPEVHARLANGSWERVGDYVLDETAATLRLAAGGANASATLYASVTNTGADVTYPSAQGDSPHGWVRALKPPPPVTNWTFLGKGEGASGRGASLVRPRRPGEPVLIAADGARVAAAYSDRVDTYVTRYDPTTNGWAAPVQLDWAAAGGTRDTARVAALAQDGATTYALVATDELDGGVAAYVLKLDAGGGWTRVGPGPAARSGVWRWAGLALDDARAPVVALGGPPRVPSPTPYKSPRDDVSPAVAAAAAAPPPGAPPTVAAAVVRYEPLTRTWTHLPPLVGPTSSGGAIASHGDELVVATVVPGGKPAVARSVRRGPWGAIRKSDPLPPVADVSTLSLGVLPGGGPVLAYQAARKRGPGPLVAACERCTIAPSPAAAPAAAAAKAGAAPTTPAAAKGVGAPAVSVASAAGGKSR